MTDARQQHLQRLEEIAAERERLEDRRSEIQADIERDEAALEGAQEALIEGEEGASDRAAELQARITSHKQARALVEEKLEGLREEQSEAETAAEAEATRAEMASLAEEATAAKERYEEAYQKVASALGEHIWEALEALEAWRESAEAFEEHAETLPGTAKASAAEVEDRGADLEATREQAPSWRKVPDNRYSPPDAEGFKSVIARAFRRAESLQYQEEHGKRPIQV